MENYILNNVIKEFGNAFLKYILNYNQEDIVLDVLNKNQIKVLIGLNNLIKKAKAQCSDERELISFLSNIESRSIYQRLMIKNPKLVNLKDNTIEALCIQKTYEYYPVLLIKPNLVNKNHHTSYRYHLKESHQDINKIRELLRNDKDLNDITIKSDKHYIIEYKIGDNCAPIYCSDSDFIERIICGSFRTCCNRGNYTLFGLIKEVNHNIDKLRKIARGEKIQYSIFNGFSSLHIDYSNTINLGDNYILRNITTIDIPSQEIQNTLGYRQKDKKITGCISEYKQVLYTKEIEDLKNIKLTHIFCLAIIFTLNSTHGPTYPTFYDTDLPLNNLSFLPQYDKRTGTTLRTLINRKQSSDIKKYRNHLNSINIKNIEITLRRLQYAMTERTNFEDKIVDGFIALESIFSKRENTKESIVKSVTMFLKEDKTFSKKIGKLYDKRCDIVHGRKFHNEYEVGKDIIDIVVSCLKLLIFRQDLLVLSSSQRVDYLFKELIDINY